MNNELPGPGVYTGISSKEYHALPYVSNSYLSRLAQCPAKAKLPFEETPTLLFGRAFHSLTLEGEDAFFREFAVMEKVDKRTKEGKAYAAQFEIDNIGKDVISEDDRIVIYDMAQAVMSHPTAGEIIKRGIPEQSIFWQDEATGIMCKCRPDNDPDCLVLADLKSTADASEHAFKRSMVTYGYARQAAMYNEGIFYATDKKIEQFVFIACEKEPPYRVEVYVPDMEFIGWGYDEYRKLLDVELACRKAGKWPHYQNPGAQDIFCPMYLKKGAYE
jgi:hypothetical protein